MEGNYFHTPNLRCYCADGGDAEKWMYLRDNFEMGFTGLNNVQDVVGEREEEAMGNIQKAA